MNRPLLLVGVAALTLLTSRIAFSQAPASLSGPEKSQIRKDLEVVATLAAPTLTQANDVRAKALLNLYADAASKAGVTIEAWRTPVRQGGAKTGAVLPVRNVVVRLNGSDPDRLIVVGAHLDRVNVGEGAIDDWSGCAAAVNLYRRLASATNRPHHTILFVGFAYEESGLWGSQSFVDDLQSQGLLAKVEAMVNLECLGVSGLHIWENGSSRELINLALQTGASISHLPITSRQLSGVGADSVPFLNAGVPAITFDSLAAADFPKIHSTQDNLTSIHRGTPSNAGYSTYFDACRFAEDFVVAIDLLPVPNAALTPRRRLAQPLDAIPFHPTTSSVAAGESSRTKPNAKQLEVHAAIDQANRQWSEAIQTWHTAEASGDEEMALNAQQALREVYTTDAVLVPPNGRVVRGGNDIVSFYAGLARVAQSASLRSLAVESQNALAYEHGEYLVTFDDHQGSQEKGKSYVVWRLERTPETHELRAKYIVDIWYPEGTTPFLK